MRSRLTFIKATLLIYSNIKSIKSKFFFSYNFIAQGIFFAQNYLTSEQIFYLHNKKDMEFKKKLKIVSIQKFFNLDIF